MRDAPSLKLRKKPCPTSSSTPSQLRPNLTRQQFQFLMQDPQNVRIRTNLSTKVPCTSTACSPYSITSYSVVGRVHSFPRRDDPIRSTNTNRHDRQCRKPNRWRWASPCHTLPLRPEDGFSYLFGFALQFCLESGGQTCVVRLSCSKTEG